MTEPHGPTDEMDRYVMPRAVKCYPLTRRGDMAACDASDPRGRLYVSLDAVEAAVRDTQFQEGPSGVLDRLKEIAAAAKGPTLD